MFGKSLALRYINVNDRVIVFKYLHQILPTNQRLFQIRLRDNPACGHCTAAGTRDHLFLYCIAIQRCVKWLCKVIFYLCGINANFVNVQQFLTLDLPRVDNKVKNTLLVVLCSFISCVWLQREDLDIVINVLKSKIVTDQSIKMAILNEHFVDYFTENYVKGVEYIHAIV